MKNRALDKSGRSSNVRTDSFHSASGLHILSSVLPDRVEPASLGFDARTRGRPFYFGENEKPRP